MFVVVFGNPLSGYRVHGTFKTHAEAETWAGDQPEPTYTVMPLNGLDEMSVPFDDTSVMGE